MAELAALLLHGLHGQLVELLMDVPAALPDSSNEEGFPPDSPVMRDRAEFPAAAEASSVTMMLSATAAEQLQGVGAMFAMIHPTVAHPPLLRSIIETAARVHWVRDAADAQSRARRAWLQLLVSRGLDGSYVGSHR